MVGVAPERSLAIENRKLSSWQFVGWWIACSKKTRRTLDGRTEPIRMGSRGRENVRANQDVQRRKTTLEYWMQEIKLEDRESDCEVGVCAADRCAKIKVFSCQAHARLQPTARK